MENTKQGPVVVKVNINAPVDKVWKFFSEPEAIKKWSFASDDWHTPHAENDLREGGKFKNSMAAKDGSFSFDFEGVYSTVKENEVIDYGLADGRQVHITFTPEGSITKVTETFDPETINPIEMQKSGWQAILNNFKKYVEAN